MAGAATTPSAPIAPCANWRWVVRAMPWPRCSRSPLTSASPHRPGLSEWRLPIGHAPYHCAVPKAGKVAAAEVLGALRRLVEQGEIEALMRAQNMATVALVVGPNSPWTQLSRPQMEALSWADSAAG